MILAFIVGVIIEHSLRTFFSGKQYLHQWRSIFYKGVVFLLLFKIGYTGGAALSEQNIGDIVRNGGLVIGLALLWTGIVAVLLKAWSPFPKLTQISTATHFGSVSVGTFVAGLAFLEGSEYVVDASVTMWLVLMEIPALIVALALLKLDIIKSMRIIFRDVFLIALIVSLVLGITTNGVLPENIEHILFKTIFTTVLVYFLFEMGRKARAAFSHNEDHWWAIIITGITLPLLGGMTGCLIGDLLGYTVTKQFVLAMLLASASYVLVPISLEQILLNAKNTTKTQINKAIATSMTMSVGVTLPFNILIGFKIFLQVIDAQMASPAINLVIIMGLITVTLLTLWKYCKH